MSGETLDDQTVGRNEPAREEIERRAYELYLARSTVKFLEVCEAGGMKLENCPAYIREWIVTERR